MGWRPFDIDLETELDALSSWTAEVVDAVAFLAILTAFWCLAVC